MGEGDILTTLGHRLSYLLTMAVFLGASIPSLYIIPYVTSPKRKTADADRHKDLFRTAPETFPALIKQCLLGIFIVLIINAVLVLLYLISTLITYMMHNPNEQVRIFRWYDKEKLVQQHSENIGSFFATRSYSVHPGSLWFYYLMWFSTLTTLVLSAIILIGFYSLLTTRGRKILGAISVGNLFAGILLLRYIILFHQYKDKYEYKRTTAEPTKAIQMTTHKKQAEQAKAKEKQRLKKAPNMF